jgi:hypothetical protein
MRPQHVVSSPAEIVGTIDERLKSAIEPAIASIAAIRSPHAAEAANADGSE